MTPVVRLAPGQVIAQVPPMIPAPRVNVVQVPPPAPHILAPRPPPVVVPAGKMTQNNWDLHHTEVLCSYLKWAVHTLFFMQHLSLLHLYHNPPSFLHRQFTHPLPVMTSLSARRWSQRTTWCLRRSSFAETRFVWISGLFGFNHWPRHICYSVLLFLLRVPWQLKCKFPTCRTRLNGSWVAKCWISLFHLLIR